MRRGVASGLSVVAAALLSCTASADGVRADPATHSVTISAVSTDCGLDAPLEFLLVGPDSDRAYEALFVTEASVAEIADAFKKAGIPLGSPFSLEKCRFWPVGVELKVEPPLASFMKETRGDATPSIVYTGGTRDANGVPEAHTNMPSAVFALYNCSQSLMQFNDSLDQSPSYGRFKPAVKMPKGEKRSFTFTWSGHPAAERVELAILPGGSGEAMRTLKAKSEKGEIDVLCDFSPELTLAEAQAVSSALATVDSARVKINGVKEGCFFFRAFMPLEKWRDRRERLSQPPEVHLLADGSINVVEIREDWSDPDSLDPKLTPVDHLFKSVSAAAQKTSSLVGKTNTILIFAPPDTKLSRLYDFKKSVSEDVPNWYVFQECQLQNLVGRVVLNAPPDKPPYKNDVVLQLPQE